jgi:hypothetical protein
VKVSSANEVDSWSYANSKVDIGPLKRLFRVNKTMQAMNQAMEAANAVWGSAKKKEMSNGLNYTK